MVLQSKGTSEDWRRQNFSDRVSDRVVPPLRQTYG